MSLIRTLTSTSTHTCAHERYLYVANEKSKGAKHKRTKDRNPFRVTWSMFVSVTLGTNILVLCVVVQPHGSHTCIFCSVKKYQMAS